MIPPESDRNTEGPLTCGRVTARNRGDGSAGADFADAVSTLLRDIDVAGRVQGQSHRPIQPSRGGRPPSPKAGQFEQPATVVNRAPLCF